MKNRTIPMPEDEHDMEKIISHAEYVADPFGKFLDGIMPRHHPDCKAKSGHSCNCWAWRAKLGPEP